jgi:hypothetical protein
MATVTARFIVSRTTPMGDKDNPYQVEVEMTPDYAQGANEDWKKASPSGVFRITIDPEKTYALESLQEGTHLHIEMTPIEP